MKYFWKERKHLMPYFFYCSNKVPIDSFNLRTGDCSLTPGLPAGFLRDCRLILYVLGSYTMLVCKTFIMLLGKKGKCLLFCLLGPFASECREHYSLLCFLHLAACSVGTAAGNQALHSQKSYHLPFLCIVSYCCFSSWSLWQLFKLGWATVIWSITERKVLVSTQFHR